MVRDKFQNINNLQNLKRIYKNLIRPELSSVYQIVLEGLEQTFEQF